MIEVILVLIIIYLIVSDEQDDGMTNGVDYAKVSQIMANPKLFSKSGTLRNAKAKLPWIDPVLYEDIRNLAIQGNFNEANIINSLSI